MDDPVVAISDDFTGTQAVESSHAAQLYSGLGTGVESPLGGLKSGLQNGLAGAHSTDDAHLSETAQVTVLREQGLTIPEIADELGIAQTDVESDLQVAVNVLQSSGASQDQKTPSAAAV